MVSLLGFTTRQQVGVPINEALLFFKEKTLKKVAAYKIQHPTPSPQKKAEEIFLWTESPIYLSSILR